MSDIAIEFRVKNARLKRAILAKWPSYSNFAKVHGINYSRLINLLGMRHRAYGVNDWREVAINIATALHMEPEELWPNEMRSATLSKNAGEFALTLEEAAQIAGPRQIDRIALTHLMGKLLPNEIKAVTAMARGEALDQAGIGLGQHGGNITSERTRQIGLKAIRKMQFAARAKGIKFADVMGET